MLFFFFSHPPHSSIKKRYHLRYHQHLYSKKLSHRSLDGMYCPRTWILRPSCISALCLVHFPPSSHRAWPSRHYQHLHRSYLCYLTHRGTWFTLTALLRGSLRYSTYPLHIHSNDCPRRRLQLHPGFSVHHGLDHQERLSRPAI